MEGPNETYSSTWHPHLSPTPTEVEENLFRGFPGKDSPYTTVQVSVVSMCFFIHLYVVAYGPFEYSHPQADTIYFNSKSGIRFTIFLLLSFRSIRSSLSRKKKYIQSIYGEEKLVGVRFEIDSSIRNKRG